MPIELDPAGDVVDPGTAVEDHPDVAFARIHGHEVAYLAAGEGPVVVLVHGIAGSSGTWARVLPSLAEHHTVIAPDLLGHGQSAKPRGDYSLGAYASGIRDLLTLLGHERATFVGHSLGGGIAMQLAYQFPPMCERLVLVASGGLGREVNPLLRLVSLPGAELVLPLVLSRHIHAALGGLTRRLAGAGVDPGALGGELWRSYTALTQPRDQAAFVHTVRSVIDLRGQRVSARTASTWPPTPRRSSSGVTATGSSPWVTPTPPTPSSRTAAWRWYGGPGTSSPSSGRPPSSPC